MTHNPQRGEVKIQGPGGKEYNLCLTLGAMAQIEEELGVESFTEVGDRISKGSSKDMMVVLVAFLNGGGHLEITKKDMITWPIAFGELSSKMQEVFNAAGFGDGEDQSEDESGN